MREKTPVGVRACLVGKITGGDNQVSRSLAAGVFDDRRQGTVGIETQQTATVVFEQVGICYLQDPDGRVVFIRRVDGAPVLFSTIC